MLTKIWVFIVAPCILISPKFFIHQQMHFLLILENSKIYIKTYIKIAPTCFGVRPSLGSLHLSLAKVALMLKQSLKLHHYVLCGGVAACYVQVWCVCVCCAEWDSLTLCWWKKNFGESSYWVGTWRRCSLWERTEFLGAFAKLRKKTVSFFMSVRLQVRPYGTTRLPLYGL
jgi:hypothetical protein